MNYIISHSPAERTHEKPFKTHIHTHFLCIITSAVIEKQSVKGETVYEKFQ